MNLFRFPRRWRRLSLALTALLGADQASFAQEAGSRVDAALQNITTLVRPGRVGYATIWDRNSYVQCRRTEARAFRCEAAGDSMQPSLRHVLTPERLSRLAAQGWALDPRFGNHVKLFPADMSAGRAADQIVTILTEAYSYCVINCRTVL